MPVRHNHEVCGARTKDGRICRNPAGHGTAHFGEGRCYLHDGRRGGIDRERSVARVIELACDPRLRDRALELLEDPELLNLRRELAVLRARFERIQMRDDDSDVERLARLAGTIGKLAERIWEMEHGRQHYLHVSVTHSIVGAFVDIAHRYIPDPGLRRAFSREVEKAIRQSLSAASARQVAAKALNPLDATLVLKDADAPADN